MDTGHGAAGIDDKIGRAADAHDHLFVGFAAGITAGIFFGRPVVVLLAGVSICHCLYKLALHSGDNGSGSSSRPLEVSAMPRSQSMVRTVDHNSDSEELIGTGQSARTLPYIRPSRGDRRISA